MASTETTLLIRNLPEELANEDKVDLLQYFGAVQVRCMSCSGRMRHCAFATFSSPKLAAQAMSRLHQLQVLGRRLTTVFATEKHKESGLFPHLSEPNRSKSKTAKDGKSVEGQEELLSKAEEFQKWLLGIMPDLGLQFPRSPLLNYKYPSPTQSVIGNIANALVAVPKFYTQVLHLMNAMNLPAPFGAPTMAPPIQPDSLAAEEEQQEEEMEFSSTEESELESDTENKSILEPAKRPSKERKKKRALKRPRLFAPPTPATLPSIPAVDPSLVFDTADVDTSAKKISFNLKPSEEAQMAPISDDTKVQVGGFGLLEPPTLLPIPGSDENQESGLKWKEAKFLTHHELDRHRISSREMKGMTVFKGYQAGVPTCRLYVKNLAKQTNEMDLFTIYGRYVNQHLDQERNMFDIRLMKEGRMKGQAFVTFANQSKAQDALKDTNGYILHGKPIVVQYARSAKPKEQDFKKKN